MNASFEWLHSLKPDTPPTDQVVLDCWNGRPTVSIDAFERDTALQWLLLGHAEPFDVWLTVPLSRDEAEELILHPPGDLDHWVAHRKGREAQLRLDWFEPLSGAAFLGSPLSWVIHGEESVMSAALHFMTDQIEYEGVELPGHMSQKQTLELLRPTLTA